MSHQIILKFKGRPNEITLVYCNCRTTPLGEIKTGSGDQWAVFNNPLNHNNTGEPFVPRTQHTANAKVFHVD